jgi:Flp pilus assembly protein TadG
MHTAKRRRDSQRGAILIHVMISMLVLIGFLTFVFDYGVMWVGRRQAQNAADAGALAGAVAVAFDPGGWTDRTVTGPARTAARRMAVANGVIGESPRVDIATDVYFTNQPADMCPTNAAGESGCIRVDVYRNQARGNPLPAFFGQAFGITAHGVRATATARVAIADSSDCLKPWAIPDKWIDNYDVTGPPDPNPPQWTEDDEFETVDRRGNPIPNPDVYIRPVPGGGAGTGFSSAPQPAGDLGRRVVLKTGSPSSSLSPGVFHPVRIPRYDGSSQGGDDYRDNIASCNGLPVGIDQVVESENGNMIGPTRQGVQDLIALDPNARWDTSTNSVYNSCQTASPSCGRSPRIVAIPVFDTATYYNTNRQGLPTFRIVNILGFFIDQMQGNDVVGYVTEMPGLVRAATAPIDPSASFLTQIQLIR